MKKLETIKNALHSSGLIVHEHHQSKSGNTILGTWNTLGTPKHHELFVGEMLKDKEILEFTY
jgi:hypothetical protein